MSTMKHLALLYAMGAMMGSGDNRSSLTPEQIDVTPKDVPIPKGCKEYFFNSNGDFSTGKMLRTECVFKCVAANAKNAVKKFKNYQKTKK